VEHHFWPDNLAVGWESYRYVIGVFILGLILIWFPYRFKEKLRGYFIGFPAYLQIIAVVSILTFIAFASQSALQPFIYFRF
jgi:alginate O-acetyltransferase complex protein AlgI